MVPEAPDVDFDKVSPDPELQKLERLLGEIEWKKISEEQKNQAIKTIKSLIASYEDEKIDINTILKKMSGVLPKEAELETIREQYNGIRRELHQELETLLRENKTTKANKKLIFALLALLTLGLNHTGYLDPAKEIIIKKIKDGLIEFVFPDWVGAGEWRKNWKKIDWKDLLKD